MKKWVDKGYGYFSSWVTYFFDKVFTQLDFGAHKNPCYFQLFLCVCNVALSIYPVLCYFTILNSIHIVFWLGTGPQYVTLGVPLVLLLLNLCVSLFRVAKPRHHAAKVGCTTLFLVLGSLLIGAGYYVQNTANVASRELIEGCGSTPMTARLEAEHARLTTFMQNCQRSRRRHVDFIALCPGFERAFPNRVFVNYLEELEDDYQCVGFCKFWAQPLFNPDAERGLRCASALGHDLKQAGAVAGFPTTMIGISLIALGILLAGYDHL